jgi:hypothetical protein
MRYARYWTGNSVNIHEPNPPLFLKKGGTI